MMYIVSSSLGDRALFGKTSFASQFIRTRNSRMNITFMGSEETVKCSDVHTISVVAIQ